MKESLKAYTDLTRIHFSFVWPILFCSGLMLAFKVYDGFSWLLLVKGVLIAFFGFEAGFVLNDYVDREVDRKDVDDKFTRYWRPFNKRPLPSGFISSKRALALFFVLVAISAILVSTLPYPHNIYVIVVGVYCYTLEYFYQIKKGNQTFPWAQLLGRTDFSLFPVAGYLCFGHPDNVALLYFLFFYPFALAHLGVNDMADIKNDEAKNLKTIPVLYGMKGAAFWVVFFVGLHYVTSLVFLRELHSILLAGFLAGFILLGVATYKIVKDNSPDTALGVLPLFHVSLLIYAVSLVIYSIV
ncbi:MAG: UbiA family prenyltransferase [Theionarchaea archaeon]|nr:UbiA family prenyltransferase [Theionarchaea archaeon]